MQQPPPPPQSNKMMMSSSSSSSLPVTQPMTTGSTTMVSLRSGIVGSILYLLLLVVMFFINDYFEGSAAVVVVLVQQPFHSYLTSNDSTSSSSVDDEAAVPKQQQQPLLRSVTSSRSSSSSSIGSGDGPLHTIQQQQSISIQKPHHTGHVMYVTEISNDRGHLIYKRIFNAPCGNGMLVFNVGPAAVYEPFTYELYDDAYAYSNNEGLCFLYPSYTGVQESTAPMWSFKDDMEMTVPLGDTPTRISTRIVIPSNTKHINTTENGYLGGDYLIIRDGNFYNPMYYKNLKYEINHWPPIIMTQEEIQMKLSQFMATTTVATV